MAKNHFNLCHDFLPIPRSNAFSRVRLGRVQSRFLLCDFQRFEHITLSVFTLDQPAILAVFNHFRGCCTVKGQNRRTAGHGFECDVAKGFGQAGEKKKVCTGIDMGQLRVRAHAHENGVRAICLQFAAVGAITREHQFHPAAILRKGLVGADDQIQVFFCSESSNRQQNQCVLVGLPL